MQLARRTRLGPFASAALPALWKALARRGWSQADLARKVSLSTAQVSRILYGERGPGRRPAAFADHELGVKSVLWDKPCPPNWKPNAYAALRPKAKRRPVRTAVGSGSLPALDSTGTDDD